MKLYAVVETNGKLELVTYPSIKAFQKTERWCDPKFIRTCETNRLYIYEEPEYRGMVIESEKQKEAHRMLHEIYKSTRR